jgi:uncharacterized protein
MNRLVRWWAAALLALAATLAFAQDVRGVPPLSSRVVDETGTLTAAQAAALEAKLAAVEQKRGSQLVVLIVATTLPEDIAAFAQRVGEQWKIGRRDVGDGLLVVVAKNDRKIRIEVAKSLEGAVPDLAARQIIANTITPAFRAGDYAGGLNAAVDALDARIAGEGLPVPEEEAPRTGVFQGFDLEDLAIFLFVAVPILATVARGVFGRKGGALATGGAVGAVAFWITTSLVVAGIAGVVALVVAGLGGLGGGLGGGGRARRGGGLGGGVPWGGGWSGGSSGGGWSGGGGGGGFSSGGGGDFGGGGASGDW